MTLVVMLADLAQLLQLDCLGDGTTGGLTSKLVAGEQRHGVVVVDEIAATGRQRRGAVVAAGLGLAMRLQGDRWGRLPSVGQLRLLAVRRAHLAAHQINWKALWRQSKRMWSTITVALFLLQSD